MTTVLCASLLFGYTLQEKPPTPHASKGLVVTVSPRALTTSEDELLQADSGDKKTTEVPQLGAFFRFQRKGIRFAISQKFLDSEEYDLAKRAMKRLGEIWSPGSVVPLEGETDIRQWLARSCPDDRRGKATNDAAVCRLTVQPWLGVTRDGTTVWVPVSIHHFPPPEEWPMPKSQTPSPDGVDDRRREFPGNMVVSVNAGPDRVHALSRISMIAELMAEWEEGQQKALKDGCRAFYKKYDDSLTLTLGDSRPSGRSFASLQPEVARHLVEEMRDRFELLGFRDAEEAVRWVQGSTVTAIKSNLTAELPTYDKTTPLTTIFPVHIP